MLFVRGIHFQFDRRHGVLAADIVRRRLCCAHITTSTQLRQGPREDPITALTDSHHALKGTAERGERHLPKAWDFGSLQVVLASDQDSQNLSYDPSSSNTRAIQSPCQWITIPSKIVGYDRGGPYRSEVPIIFNILFLDALFQMTQAGVTVSFRHTYR